MDTVLEYQGITKSFFGVPVLKGVTFSLGAARVMGLVGENGAGKSTLMNILGGVLRPDGGNLRLAGESYAPDSPLDARARGIAFIHQELNLFPNLTVAENVFISALPTKGPGRAVIDRRTMRRRTEELLRAVDLAVSPDALVETLSPGERQLVEIAKALSIDARVVIFDEPTTSLTAREAQRLFALIERLRTEGRSVIYISHALEDVMRLCDDIVVLRDGAVVGAGPKTTFTVDRLIALMVGRTLDQLFPTRDTQPSNEVLLDVRAVSQPGVVENISFALHRGEVLGVAGLMGSGRTELARALFGLDPREGGEVRLAGEVLPPTSPAASIARGMAFLTESRRDEGLLMPSGIRANVALARLGSYAGPGGLLDAGRLGNDVEEVSRAVRISDDKLRLDVPVKTLSGGNQQKVVLAKWLLTRPKVFILDEPTRGIDVGAKSEIYRLINQLVGGGAGALVISSEIEELVGLCDRILVMRRGELAGEVRRGQFDREHILRLAFGGASAPASGGKAS